MQYFSFNHQLVVDTTVPDGAVQSDLIVLEAFNTKDYEVKEIRIGECFATLGVGVLSPAADIRGGVTLLYNALAYLNNRVVINTPGTGTLFRGLSISGTDRVPFVGCMPFKGGQLLTMTVRYWNLPSAANLRLVMNFYVAI